ncbi:MAG: Uma2 family endonuclease [Acidobacteria bacterium]|nr:Uma2 family endonuclease [Acidobacteriota bacterium]
MSRATTTAKLTYEDLLKLPDDDKRHEIIDGVHYVMSSPVLRHQRVVRRLGVSIANFVDATDRGEVFFVDVDVVLSPYDVVVPDLLYVSEERRHLLQEKNIPGAPDLAAEVLSPSTRRKDRVLKRRLFEREGVREYWILDPDRNTVRLYHLAPEDPEDPGDPVGAGYGDGVELAAAAGDVLTTPLLPGWSLPLSVVFA